VVSELDSGSGLHGRRCEANPPPSTSPGEDDAVGWTSSSADGGQTEGKAVKGLPEPREATFSWLLLSFGSRKEFQDRLHTWSWCI
jgi:hypothetical protein